MRKCGYLLIILSALLLGLIWTSPQAFAQSPPDLLSLEQARQLARSHNRDLNILRLNLQIAQQETTEARSKAFPQVTSSFSYMAFDKTRTLGPDPVFTESSVSLEQTLFHLGIWAGIRAANRYQQMEKFTIERFRQTLDSLITEAYLGILKVQKEVEVLEELEKNTQEHLRDTQNFYQEGMVPKTDLLQTELMLSQVQRDLLSGKNQQQKLWTTFKILLGIDLSQTYQLQEVSMPKIPERTLPELQREALSSREDLKKLLTEREYLENIRQAYQSRHYPSISAFGSWNYTTNEGEDQKSYGVGGVRLTFPLFTGFGITAQEAQARSQFAQNELRSKDLKDKIYQEVEAAYLDYQKVCEDHVAAQKEVAQAEENLRITNDLYRESMTTNTEVLDAQTLLARAKNNLNNTRYDQIAAIQKLSLAIGK